MFALRLAAAAAIALSCAACAGHEPRPAQALTKPDVTAEAATRGQQFAARACASCHAIGATGASPMAAAPPFREIVQRYPLDQLEARFAGGLVTGHPAMPAFVFRASEIDDLVAWLEAVRTKP